MNRQKRHLSNTVHNYLLEPGDATCYRFAFQEFPVGDAYTLDSGVGKDGEDYIWFAINMPGGSGVGTVSKGHLKHYREHPEYDVLTGWLVGNGFGNVNPYTLRAVVLALSVLIKDPTALDAAAEAMLEARTHA